MAKKTIVLGFLGTTLDSGKGDKRWSKWRPTVDLCRHEDLLVDRLELLYDPDRAVLAQRILQDLESVSPETQVVLRPFVLRDPWDFEEVFGALHELSRSYRFDTDHEDYLVHITTGTHVAQICWFLLTESRHFPAKLLQTSPAGKKRHAEPGSYAVIDLDLSRYDGLARRFTEERLAGLSFLKNGIDTRSPRFNSLIEDIERVALRSKEPVLLMGPTGAGKSQLAGQIHALKKSRGLLGGPLVEVNCATIRGDAAMSALFGHVRGAFTGAARDRAGLLRAADGGVLFLDEVGELGVDEQAMLLRAIEEKRFLPVGSEREVTSHFQLIAGTNRDLRAEARDGRFRDDLLARIDVWTFTLPGLRDRPEDIEPNLDFELDRVSVDVSTRVTMNREAREMFMRFATSPATPWRGNFRDFRGAVLRMATLAEGGRIDRAQVDAEVARLTPVWGAREADGEDDLTPLFGTEKVSELDLFDQVQLAEVVRVCRRSQSLSEAGRTLFSESRKRRTSINDADRVRKYLLRFGLSWDQVTG